jgi:hypothetical protein
MVVFTLLFLLAVGSRLVPHVWSFTLTGACFLFAGSYFQDKKFSFLLMISAMLFSDFFIGFHNQMLSVYLGMFLVVAVGYFATGKTNRFKVFGLALLGSTLFYLVTNFGVWFEGTMYPMNFTGLVQCYVMGLPFYKMQLLADVVFTVGFFEVAKHVNLLQSSHSSELLKI